MIRRILNRRKQIARALAKWRVFYEKVTQDHERRKQESFKRLGIRYDKRRQQGFKSMV